MLSGNSENLPNENGDRLDHQHENRIEVTAPTPENGKTLFKENNLKEPLKKFSKPFNNLKEKQLWDWFDLTGKLALPVILALLTLIWNVKTSNDAAEQYRQGLVKEYVESIKGLLLDYYHKTGNVPEIKVEEVQAFVKSKTAATLIAINAEKEGKKQTTILINFLQEAGIGFIPKYDKNGKANKNQDICTEDAINFKKQPKIIDFSHFLCGIDLTKANLANVEFASVILEDANLYQADLENANLFTADLENANLNEAILAKATLKKANLRGSFLSSTNLENADLTNANLAGAFMDSRENDNQRGKTIKYPKTNLKNSTLLGVNLKNASLNNVDLTGANLSPYSPLGPEKIKDQNSPIIRVNLEGANLERANLENAVLIMANLRGAKLQKTWRNNRTNFNGSIYNQYTCFPDGFKPSMIKNSSLYMIFIPTDPSTKPKEKICNGKEKWPLECKDLKNVDLRGADLRSANLSNADLRGANLLGADLRQANLKGAIIDERTQLKDAIYDDKTKLSFIVISEEKTEKVKKKMWKIMWKIMPTANLKNANLSGQDLTGTDLSGANFHGADLSNVQLDRWTKLEKASYDDQSTKLPFSTAEARKRKMVYKPYKEVKVLNESNPQKKAGVDWQDMSLVEADFTQTDLTGARLQRANLTKATLLRTILKYAKLKEADLTDANLRRANLTHADLTGADLTGADLRWANLTCANLSKAKMNLKIDEKTNDLKNVLGIQLDGAIMPNGKRYPAGSSGCAKTKAKPRNGQ